MANKRIAFKEDGWVARIVTNVRADEQYDNGLTKDVSVTWGKTEMKARQNVRGMQGEPRARSVKDILKMGGRVQEAPEPDNQNHCHLVGLKKKDLNSLFS